MRHYYQCFLFHSVLCHTALCLFRHVARLNSCTVTNRASADALATGVAGGWRVVIFYRCHRVCAAESPKQFPASKCYVLDAWFIFRGRLGGYFAATVLLVLSLVIASLLSKELDELLLGDLSAGNTGVSIWQVKIIIALCSTLIVAVAVSKVGIIGLIVPHAEHILSDGKNLSILTSCFPCSTSLLLSIFVNASTSRYLFLV